jgi:hypothetical protein
MDTSAVDVFKTLWARQQNNDEYLGFSMEKVLSSIQVLSDEGINYAGLVLFAKSEKISELLPGAEIIFEWRQEEKIGHDFRKEWRAPFFSIFDDIWSTINARNIRFPFQEGFIQREVFAFNEKTIREAVLNAVTHRDYNIQSQSVFIKASPEQFQYLAFFSFFPANTALIFFRFQKKKLPLHAQQAARLKPQTLDLLQRLHHLRITHPPRSFFQQVLDRLKNSAHIFWKGLNRIFGTSFGDGHDYTRKA